MSDQSGLVELLTWDNLPQFRNTILEAFGVCRKETVAYYTSGPQTLAPDVDLVIGNCAGGSFTINLPSNPTDGDRYEALKLGATNTLTIGRNGETINGVAADSTLTGSGDSIVFTWSSDADTWGAR